MSKLVQESQDTSCSEELTKTLEDILLNQEELDSLDLENKDILRNYVQIAQESVFVGTTSIDSLKAILSHRTDLFEILFVKFIDEETWESLKTHALFQRRKLQIVTSSIEDLNPEILLSFYTLKNGEKKGPYAVEEIKEKLRTKELLATDLLSLANTQTHEWKKLYTFKEFDRRDHLPKLPGKHLPFTYLHISTTDHLNQDEEFKENALLDLARSQKAFPLSTEEKKLESQKQGRDKENEIKDEKSKSTFLKMPLICALLITTLFTIYYASKGKEEKVVQESIKVQGKAQANNAIIPFVPQKKNSAFGENLKSKRSPSSINSPNKASLLKRRPRPSFTNSKAFQDRNNSAIDKVAEKIPDEILHGEVTYADHEPSVIYEGVDVSSIEFDEIRSHLSQEVFEEEYGTESFEYNENELGPSSDEHSGLYPVETLEYIFEAPEASDIEFFY